MANFYMVDIENKVQEALRPEAKPAIYSRYVDDIFVVVSNVGQISELKAALINSSVLTFTHELEKKKVTLFPGCKFAKKRFTYRYISSCETYK